MCRKFFYFLFIFAVSLSPQFSVAQTTGEAALADKYFEEGEYNSALDLYEKLNRQEPLNRHFVYRITACYDKTRNYDAAIKFLDKAIRREPEAYELEIMKAAEMEKSGDGKGSERVLDELIGKKLRTIGDFSLASGFFLGMNNTDRAVATILQGRKVNKNDNLFATELAQIFQRQGKYDPATREYLKIYAFDPMSYAEVRQNILNLVSASSAPEVERVLLEAVQKNQKDQGIRSLVYDFYVLNEQFMEAFIQVKSMDKVFSGSGERVFQFAMTMRSNHNYNMSNKAFDYVIETHPQSPFYFQSYQEKTVNGEMEAFEKIPLDTFSIKAAVKAYDDLLNTFGRNTSFFDAIYRKSRLQAFYLFDLKSALAELEAIVAMPLKPKEKAQANLLIGDIYLMQKEFNKSKLKYSEVDLQFKDEQIGALAKFKDGQLSYYKGDFEESQARLKSIKDNTSNDISNDAIRLYLLIQDNTGLDSTPVALKQFAQAQLLVFQREYDEAWVKLDSLAYEFPNHSLQDEILWEKSKILLNKNQVNEALVLLNKILDKFGTDIYGDDALFTIAKIYDYNFKDSEKAMELYLKMLREYPGSLFSVDVRKRIRELRKEKL